ncbi:hypothetical protein RFI_32514 [Reticulomyxa filosa]|uniref:Uncharacterized protein n=1 Tax=Reticulomyxa filosa TaxID=46433 RepID=X6LUT7_RETFI|nr:hypothetical protein RFI_32514 [Reticulomyxa filosa]|eukprot:ETO04882.1 hypothetical protein RFI_32514 [Reticulomyxa filosa]
MQERIVIDPHHHHRHQMTAVKLIKSSQQFIFTCIVKYHQQLAVFSSYCPIRRVIISLMFLLMMNDDDDDAMGPFVSRGTVIDSVLQHCYFVNACLTRFLPLLLQVRARCDVASFNYFIVHGLRDRCGVVQLLQFFLRFQPI